MSMTTQRLKEVLDVYFPVVDEKPSIPARDWTSILPLYLKSEVDFDALYAEERPVWLTPVI